MTQEDKDLLIRDLCARLPYSVKVFYEYVDDLDKKTYGYSLTLNTLCIDALVAEKAIIKPYLRPMSSMTEEEKKEFKKRFNWELKIDEIWGHSVMWNTGSSDEYIDVEFELVDMDLISVWLDKKMFDWRRVKKDNMRISMIKAGLALPASEGMYNEIKEE